jgi:tripartite-type tricarboxylate transporter receptor subunit TctC
MTRFQIRFHTVVAALVIVSSADLGCAQGEYPVRPIRMLYGFPAGTDVGARHVAEKLAERLGRPVVFENITGAAGNIAADQTAHAPPDGYTVGMLTGANVVLRPLLYRTIPYDVLKALVPVTVAWRFPNVLVVGADTQVKDLPTLVERARRTPDGLTFGHLGQGSVTQLAGELLKLRANIDLRGVPYRSAPALVSDVISGRIDMAFIPPSTAVPLANQGKIRALATTSLKRVPFALDLPSIAEQGFPDFEVSVWFGLFVPAGTPQHIVDRLGTELRAIITAPDMRDWLLQLGLEPIGGTQADFRKMIADERLLWSDILQKAGIQPIE